MTATLFCYLFLAALALMLGLKGWLALRQAASVSAHRDAVPADFAAAVDLAAHRKAADYTRAKLAFGLIETVFGALVLVALTLAGGIDAAFGWAGSITPGFWREVLGAGAVFGFDHEAAIGGERQI